MNIGSLKYKVTFLVGFFVVFMLIVVGTTFYVANSQSSDARIIDIAGRQRMLTFKIAKETFDLVSALESESSTEDLREELFKTVSLFNKSLNALKDGGTTLETDGNEVTLPGSRGETKLQLDKLAEMWVPIRKSIDLITVANVDVTSSEFYEATAMVEEGRLPLIKETNKAVMLIKEASERKTTILKTVQVSALLLTIVSSIIAWVLANRFVIQPIVQTVAVMDMMANRDFTHTLSSESNSEIGKMGQAVNSVVKTLGVLFDKIAKTSYELATSSEHLAVSSAEITQGAETQATQSERVAAAMSEMSATVAEVAQNTQTAAEMAKNAQEVATKGGQVVLTAVDSIEQLTSLVEKTADEVKDLGNNSEQISEIIAVIDDIADQTNLLALNAAIEAARAGEQGRGFAVVADEVRQLAERTTKATSEVRERIGTVQEETSKVVLSMEDGAKKSEEGIRLVREAGDVLEEIVASVNKVTEMVQQIATAADEQSAAAEEISSNVEGMASITSETTNKVKGSSEAIQALNKTAEELKDLVEGFRV